MDYHYKLNEFVGFFDVSQMNPKAERDLSKLVAEMYSQVIEGRKPTVKTLSDSLFSTLVGPGYLTWSYYLQYTIDHVKLRNPASNLSEIIEAVTLLKKNPSLRKAMIRNGLKRADEFRPEKITHQWEALLTNTIIPAYAQWKSSPAKTVCLFILRYLSETIYRPLKNRITK